MSKLIFPPPGGGKHVINGTTYQSADGVSITVSDDIANQLCSSGWSLVGGNNGGTGTTAQRPAAPPKGASYSDTTLGLIIHWDGAHWRNPITNAIV